MKHFILSLLLLLPFHAVHAQDASHFVYVSHAARNALAQVYRSVPQDWSAEFKDLCSRIERDGIAAPAGQVKVAIAECLKTIGSEEKHKDARAALESYAEALLRGDADLALVDEAGMITRACGSCNTDCNTDCRTDCRDKCIKYKKTKAFCNLLAHDLSVDGSGFIANLTAGTLRVTGNSVFSGDVTINGETFGGDAIFDNLTVEGTFTANGVSNIGANSTNDAINIGTGAATGGRTITIGNSTVGTNITLNSGTGLVSVVPEVVTVAATSATFTPATRVGEAIFTGNLILLGNSQDFTINDAGIITTTSPILVSVTNLNVSGNNGYLGIKGVTQSAGSIIVHTINNGAGSVAPGDNVIITFWVLN